MQNLKTKTIAILIIALLTSSIGTMALANAHTPAWDITTYAYCSVAPNPAGLGQLVTIGMWVQIPPPTAAGTNGDRWHGFNVTITDPDGIKKTLGPFTSDATGGTWTSFTPDKLGNYSFVVNYPGETMKGENRADPKQRIHRRLLHALHQRNGIPNSAGRPNTTTSNRTTTN